MKLVLKSMKLKTGNQQKRSIKPKPFYLIKSVSLFPDQKKDRRYNEKGEPYTTWELHM